MELWGAGSRSIIVPFAVPGWETSAAARAGDLFTVGYAGRLVTSKGVDDLLKAVAAMQRPARLVLVGEGPERERLEAAPGVTVQIGWSHENMNQALSQFDVLVLPSRTTPSWKEQFGRVLLEALWCGVPVVGSDSGEIPHLIERTGGGRIFPEGDVLALAAILDELADSPELCRSLAETGEAVARRSYSVSAIADMIETLLFDSS